MRAPLMLVTLLSLAAATATEVAGQVSEGNKPFVPTRLEWLELYLNAGRGVTYSPKYGYGINYVADAFGDAIVIVAVYHPDHVDEDVMRNAIRSAKSIIVSYARKREWTWLKVREEVKSLSGSGQLDSTTDRANTAESPESIAPKPPKKVSPFDSDSAKAPPASPARPSELKSKNPWDQIKEKP